MTMIEQLGKERHEAQMALSSFIACHPEVFRRYAELIEKLDNAVRAESKALATDAGIPYPKDSNKRHETSRFR